MTILHLAPDAPLALRAAAEAALVLHIGGAFTGLIAGPAALVFRKGSFGHRAAGNLFFAGMLAMSGIGAVVAPMFPDRGSSLAGAFTFYLVLTGWVAAKRGPGQAGRFELIAFVYALGVAAAALALAQIGAHSPKGRIDGEPYQILYGFLAVSLLAAGSDLKVVLGRGLSGGARLARHLWRMCLALFVAAGSFAAQPKAQPDFVRGAPWLILPAFVVLGVMIYWLVKVRLKPRRARAPVGASLAGAAG